MALLLSLVLSLLKLGSGQWQLFGPNKAVQALVGEDAAFSCFLSPKTNAEAMEVRFFRGQRFSVVHLYRDGKDQPFMQMPQYQGRTKLVKDSIAGGRLSLRLENITVLDAGLYGCWIGSQSSYYQEATWELQVSALGSVPLISIVGYVDRGIQLLCRSSGWFPRPMAKWKGPQGQDLSADSRTNMNMHGLFDVELSLTVQENAGSVSCSMQHAHLSQEVESRVQIGDTFFQPVSWYLATKVLGILCCGLFFGIVGLKIFFSKFQGKREREAWAGDLFMVPAGTGSEMLPHPSCFSSSSPSLQGVFEQLFLDFLFSNSRFLSPPPHPSGGDAGPRDGSPTALRF
uniref:Butyrophilin like 8 n=1 Tax=Macaca nemestrina TaxID=9545 RepID=A0A2K6BXF0_MACNE